MTLSFIKRTTAGALAATSALALVLCAVPALADDQAAPDDGTGDAGVARLSVLNGNVDLKRADSGDTVAAVVNAPVSAGDYVTTHEDSRVEVDYGFGSVVRVAPDTQLRFTRLDPGDHTLQLAEGTVEMRVFRGLDAHPEVETPTATIRPDEKGQYRVTVTSDGNTEVTVRRGRADVVTSVATQAVAPGSTLLIEGANDNLHTSTIDELAADSFDDWNNERDAAYENVPSYVDQGIVGVDDLGAYGHWVDQPTYGYVWQPTVAAGWAPYHDGRWVWEPYYGWTWIGAEPWGYAPYHYGNWFFANDAWFWYPGVYAAAPIYSPALVGFFSFGFGGGGFGFGFGNIGWVPLAPFERFHPWWGRYNGGGVTVVNNITNITNVTNVRDVTIYKNFRVPGAPVGVTSTAFINGEFNHKVQISQPDVKTIRPVNSVLPVVPTAHNLVLDPNAKGPVAAAPVSTRFASFHDTRAVRQPAFTTQREAVASAAQKAYPEHAAEFAHTAPSASTNAERSTTNTERSTETTERSTPSTERNTATESAPAQRPTTNGDVWSRFGDNGKPTTESRPATTTNESRPATTPATQSGSHGATSSESGGAWHRFDSGSSANSTATSHATSSHTTYGGNTYGGGTNGSRTPGSGSYGSNSVPAYHHSAPVYHQAPATHAPAAHAPAMHAPSSSPSHAHASAPKSSGSSAPKSDHGH
jgi:hypothetical protein